MEPNYNFDESNNNNTEMEVENTHQEPRVITITKSRLAAFRGLGYTRSQIATEYGVTQQEVYQAMVEFGMVKARTEKTNLPSYIIQTVNDIEDPVKNEVAETTEA